MDDIWPEGADQAEQPQFREVTLGSWPRRLPWNEMISTGMPAARSRSWSGPAPGRTARTG